MPAASAFATETRTSNHLLQTLDRGQDRVILRMLEHRAFQPGEVMPGGSGGEPMIWFPETVVARITWCAGPQATAIGLVGCEGLIGGDALLSEGLGRVNAVVILRGGTALGAPLATLQRLCTDHPMLTVAMMQSSLAFGLDVARILASAVHETGEQRLIRWLLMLDARAAGMPLPVTHQELGDWTGLRRASVTDCLHVLEGHHLVRCERGRMIVRDRAGLALRLQRR